MCQKLYMRHRRQAPDPRLLHAGPHEALAMIEALEYFASRVADPDFTPENFTEALELIARQRGVDPELIRVRLMAIVSMVDPNKVETVDDLNREIADRRKSLS